MANGIAGVDFDAQLRAITARQNASQQFALQSIEQAMRSRLAAAQVAAEKRRLGIAEERTDIMQASADLAARRFEEAELPASQAAVRASEATTAEKTFTLGEAERVRGIWKKFSERVTELEEEDFGPVINPRSDEEKLDLALDSLTREERLVVEGALDQETLNKGKLLKLERENTRLNEEIKTLRAERFEQFGPDTPRSSGDPGAGPEAPRGRKVDRDAFSQAKIAARSFPDELIEQYNQFHGTDISRDDLVPIFEEMSKANVRGGQVMSALEITSNFSAQLQSQIGAARSNRELLGGGADDTVGGGDMRRRAQIIAQALNQASTNRFDFDNDLEKEVEKRSGFGGIFTDQAQMFENGRFDRLLDSVESLRKRSVGVRIDTDELFNGLVANMMLDLVARKGNRIQKDASGRFFKMDVPTRTMVILSEEDDAALKKLLKLSGISEDVFGSVESGSFPARRL